MKLKLLLVLGAFGSQAACVHSSERLKEELTPFVGQAADVVVEQWGAPDSTYTMDSGKKVLTYSSDRQVNRFSNYGYSAYRLGNYSYTESCKINFYSDPLSKKIESYSINGDANNCVEMLKDMKNVR